MIIDVHGHYTTVPQGVDAYRGSQISQLSAPSKGKMNVSSKYSYTYATPTTLNNLGYSNSVSGTAYWLYEDANMKLDVWQKDMAIIADFARRLGSPTPLFTATGPLYTAAVAMGLGAQDTGAVCAVLEDMAGVHRKPGCNQMDGTGTSHNVA